MKFGGGCAVKIFLLKILRTLVVRQVHIPPNKKPAVAGLLFGGA
jgi:hypothetical protein